MNDKAKIIRMLRDEFERWEELLGGLSEEQIIEPKRMEALSIKDIVAHVTTWQEISVARMEAALDHREPVFPGWPAELDPDTDEDLDRINAWIYESRRVSALEGNPPGMEGEVSALDRIGGGVPEKDLMEVGRYAWIEGYALAAVLVSSYEHHEEHLEALMELLGRSKKD